MKKIYTSIFLIFLVLSTVKAQKPVRIGYVDMNIVLSKNDNFLDKGNLSNILQKSKIVEIGRVKDIILNTQYPQIEKYGGSTAIGNIFFEFNNFISPENNLAKPLFPQLSSYPLVNEMVLIFKLPNIGIGNVTSTDSK